MQKVVMRRIFGKRMAANRATSLSDNVHLTDSREGNLLSHRYPLWPRYLRSLSGVPMCAKGFGRELPLKYFDLVNFRKT